MNDALRFFCGCSEILTDQARPVNLNDLFRRQNLILVKNTCNIPCDLSLARSRVPVEAHMYIQIVTVFVGQRISLDLFYTFLDRLKANQLIEFCFALSDF